MSSGTREALLSTARDEAGTALATTYTLSSSASMCSSTRDQPAGAVIGVVEVEAEAPLAVPCRNALRMGSRRWRLRGQHGGIKPISTDAIPRTQNLEPVSSPLLPTEPASMSSQTFLTNRRCPHKNRVLTVPSTGIADRPGARPPQ